MIANEIWCHPYWLFDDAAYLTGRLDLLAGRATHLVTAWHSDRGASGRSNLWLGRTDSYGGLTWLEFVCQECAARGIQVVPRFPVGGYNPWFGLIGKRITPLPTSLDAASVYPGHPNWLNLLDPASHIYVLEAIDEFFELNAHLLPFFAPYAHLDYARMYQAVTGVSRDEGCAIINDLVRQIKAHLPGGWALDYTCSSEKTVLDNTYRDPVTLLREGTIRRVKVLNYTIDAPTRLARVLAWDNGPDWPDLAQNCIPGIGTDASLGAAITPEFAAASRDALLDADFGRLYWFVLGTGSTGNPERMPPEMIELIPVVEQENEIMAAITDLQAVELELRNQAATSSVQATALTAQADVIAAVIIALSGLDTQADAAVVEAQEALAAAQTVAEGL